MKYLFDTNIIIDHIRGKLPILPEMIKEGAAISIISYGELIYGAYKSSVINKTLSLVTSTLNDLSLEIINLNQTIMDRYAQIKSLLETKGTRLDDLDLLIAATALDASLIFVTRNKKHFSRVSKLQIY